MDLALNATARQLRCRRVAKICGWLAFVTGSIVLSGWLLGLQRLTDFTFDGINMKANTALALALTGASLLLCLAEAGPRWRARLALALAGTVSLIGALTLSEHLFGWDLQIDQVLAVEPPGSPATASPGRMGPPASTSYTLLGIALTVLSLRKRRWIGVAQAIAIAVAAVALLNFVGNFYGARQLYSIAMYTGISRQTWLMLLVSAVGLLTARPTDGLMSLFTSDGSGGVIFRRLMLPSLLFPILFGRLTITGIELGWFDATFGIALFSLVLIGTLVAVTWWNSSVLNVLSLRRLQAEREREVLLESERHARAEVERSVRLKDEFLATLSHELRTPLNAIVGWSHILQNKINDPATLARGLEIITRNARMQSELISDLLDMSRIISGKMRLDVLPVDLPSVINGAVESIRLAAEQKSVRLQVHLEHIDEPLMGDAGRLQQVVWNLLSNSVKFTPRGGRVQLAVTRVGTHVRIVVSDNGQGISPEFLPHVFDRFRQADASITRNKGGLGLGLAIVKELVELHGGKVTMQSEGPEMGATCVVEVPLARADEPAPKADTVSAAAGIAVYPLRGVTILLLEDEADTREVIRRILAEHGAEVTAAGEADEAMERLRHQSFSVLVSDIGMPHKSGYEFIKEVRAYGFTMPALALTAYARREDRDRALEAGFQHHLTKPVDPAELVSRILTMVDSEPRRHSVAG